MISVARGAKCGLASTLLRGQRGLAFKAAGVGGGAPAHLTENLGDPMPPVRQRAVKLRAGASLRIRSSGADGSVQAVLLRGDYDMETVQDLDNSLRRVFGPFFYRRALLLDLEGVDFVDSSFISYLISLIKRMRPEGHDLVLSRPRGQVRRALVTVGLPNVVPVYDDLDEAAALMAEGRLPLIPPPLPLVLPPGQAAAAPAV